MDDQSGSNVEYIQQCGFFSALPDEKIAQLSPVFEKITLQAGQILFSQGDSSDFLYILIKGKLISLLITPGNQIKVVGTINPIETVGELGSISGEIRSLTVKAIMDSELLRLPSDTFKELCLEYPIILSKVSKIIIDRAIKTIKLMAYEKTRNAAIILPLLKNIPITTLKDRLKENLNQNKVAFLSSEEHSSDEMIKNIKKSERANRQIFIFMEAWKPELFKLYVEKVTHFYLVVYENERAFALSLWKEILKDLQLATNLRLELIILHPENTKQIVNTRQWLEIANFSLHHHIRINQHDDYQRLVRFATGNAFTLVLGGGGAKGLGHLGVIKSLVDKGITIDAVGGTSVGAAMAAAYAFTMNYKKTFGLINQLKKAVFQSLSIRNLTWPLISLYSASPGTEKLIELVNHVCIEDLWIPYFAVSSNLSESKEVVHRTGLLWEAVRSSVSLPGIFPPVVFDGQLLFDGGLLNNLPVDVMREIIGYGHKIIAATLSKREESRQNYYFPPVLKLKQTILSRLRIAYKNYLYPPFFETFLDSLLLGSHSKESGNCHLADILVMPDLSKYRLLSLAAKEIEELIDISYRETNTAVDAFLKSHPEYKKMTKPLSD